MTSRDETIEAIRALTEALDEDEAAGQAALDLANPRRGVLATADLQYAVRHHLRTLLDHVAPLERERPVDLVTIQSYVVAATRNIPDFDTSVPVTGMVADLCDRFMALERERDELRAALAEVIDYAEPFTKVADIALAALDASHEASS